VAEGSRIRGGVALLVGLAGLLALPATAGDVSLGRDGHVRRPAQDIVRYEALVDLSGEQLRVETLVTVAAVEPLTELRLDFTGPEVLEVFIGKSHQHWERVGDELRIRLKRPIPAGGELRLGITTGGWPERGLQRTTNRYGDPVVFTESWPDGTRSWMPSEDHPSDKAELRLAITLPEGWVGVANGAPVDDVRGAAGWATIGPIYTSNIAFAAGPYAVHESRWGDVPIVSYLYPQDVEAGSKQLASHPGILDYFSELIGPYPFSKYSLVEVPTRYRAVENASCVFLSELIVDGTVAHDETLAHEAAHQWWGDDVTPEDWHDLWLSEGFATYFAALYVEHRKPGSLPGRMAAMRTKILASGDVARLPVVGAGPVAPDDLLNPNSYEKGGWVLHMLRQELGDDVFFDGLRAFYAAEAGGNATTDDLRELLEVRAGRPLDVFFDQWLGRPGVPTLRLTGARSGERGLTVGWEQPGADAPWTLRLLLRGRPADGGPPLEHTLSIEERSGEVVLPGWGAVEQLEVDPDVELLADVKFAGLAGP
jgi:aminopeptidase N